MWQWVLDLVIHNRAAAGRFSQNQAAFAKNDFDKAIVAFSAAIRLEPKDADNYFCLGRCSYELDETDMAIAGTARQISLP